VICFSTLALNPKVASAQRPSSDVDQKDESASRFRVERTPVAGGAELITIWARVVASEPQADQTEELPLISVLRDTLGDGIKENDILREVWVHTYSQPRLVQQAAALVPLLYKGLQVKPRASSASPPPAIINLSDPTQQVWRQLFLSSVISVLIDQPLLRASIHSYQRNIADYRTSNTIRALTILSLYEAHAKSDSPFSAAEVVEMQSRLALRDKAFGGLVDKQRL